MEVKTNNNGGIIVAQFRQGLGFDFEFLNVEETPVGIVNEGGEAELCGLEGFIVRLPLCELIFGTVYGVDE